MKKTKINFLLAALIYSLLLGGCFSPWKGEEEGTITINLGVASGRAAMPLWPPQEHGFLEDIDHVITISGNGNPISITAKGGQTIRCTVAVGNWNVKVDDYLEGVQTPVSPNGEKIYYATGYNSVDVQAGKTATVIIRMNPICQDCNKYPCECGIIYTVSFQTYGGTTLNPITVSSIATQPSTTKNPYTFENWYDNENCTGSPVVFPYTVTANATLYAKWSNHYYVSDSAGWDAAVAGIAGSDYYIFLNGSFSSATKTFANNGSLTIDGNGNTITLTGTGSLLRIGTGQTVTVKDVQLVGHGSSVQNDTALVYVDGGEFIMETGSLISGNTSSTDSEGGGVHIQSGTFTMNSGTISGNTVENGGGVFLRNGIFNMNGGMISGNIGTYNAGGVLISGGTFTMTAGTISGNEANSEDIDGISKLGGGFGGGVYVGSSGTFNIQGGTLYGNEPATAVALRNEAVDTGAALYIESGGTATYGVPGTSFGTSPIDIDTTITGAGP